MVFESVIVDVLNKYLKPYVKRLDSSQLNLGVWKGHARVEKLELKEDLFAEANLDVPIRIKRSYVGKLEAHIPWKNLTKEPIEITIDEVYVIVGPDLDTKYDADRHKERLRKEKAKKIKEYHDALKKKKQKQKEAKKGKKKKQKDTEKPDTFAEKLAVHMTKNLQVKVRDIHVRYEDDVTNPTSTIAAGLTLHSLNLKSTDGNWVPCVVREAATVIYKLIELNSLSIYWNTSCVSSFASPDVTLEQMIEEMRNTIARPAIAPPPTNSYLLNPMSASARLKLNLKPGVDLTLPQLLMGLECEDIVFSLQQVQLKTLLMTVESFDRHVVNQKYLKYKPSSSSVSKDPRGWWRYAITAVLEEDVKRKTQMWSWKHIKEHRENVKLYLEKYREKVKSINTSSALSEKIQELEDRLDWFNILVYREEASKKEKSKSKKDPIPQSPSRQNTPKTPTTPTATPLVLSPPLTPQQPSPGASRKAVEPSRKNSGRKKSSKKDEKKEGGFFSKLKLKMKQPSKRDSEIKQAAAASSGFVMVESTGLEDDQVVTEDLVQIEEKGEDSLKTKVKHGQKSSVGQVSEEEEQKDREELYNAIGYSPDEEFVEYPKEYVAHEVHVLFNTLTLELCGKKQKLGNLVTKKIKVDVFNRPSSESISVLASVGSLEMSGISRGNQTTTMVTSNVGFFLESDQPLIDFQLDLNPLDRPGMDVAVKTVLRPLQITYDFDTVNGLIEMFKPPKLIHFQELTNAASASWEQLKSQTTAGLQDALKNRKQIDIDVTLHSPYLVVPEKGCYSDDSCLIIVDLGQLRVFGSTKDPKDLPKVLPSKDDLSHYYDKFSVALNGMQVLVARPGEDWQTAMASGSSPLHIVDPTGFEIQLLKSIITDDALLASMRVEGTLPGFEVKLSDVAITSLIKVAATLEKPPAMITTTDEYNELPTRPSPKLLLDSASKLAELDAISLSSMSVSSFGDDDEESVADDDELCTLSPKSLNGSQALSDELDDQDVSRNVFTDVSIKLIVEKVSVKLTQTSKTTDLSSKRKGMREVDQTPLLDIFINDIRADVVDRKWDTQGSVAMREIAVKDYITKDSSGQPTYLLKTECLNDGNFVSARFVSITKVGVDFAAKYTGLEDSLSAQLSLVKLKLHRSTVKSLMQYFMALKPALDSPPPLDEDEDHYLGPGGLEPISEGETTTAAINPKDFESGGKVAGKEFHFDVQFDGIDVSLAQDSSDFLYAGLTGFSVKGSARPESANIVASVKDLVVKDDSVTSKTTAIISKADLDKNFILLNVVQYNLQTHDRDPHDLTWVDTSLKAEVNRINVNLDTTFLGNVLEFVKELDIDQSAFQTAAKATADTATVTATAIIESTKSAHRLKLDLTLHAPVVELPFYTETKEGSIYIDMGEFHISNRLRHGHDVHHGSVDSDSSFETMTVFGAQTVLDCMEIRTTSIQIFRKSHSLESVCNMADGTCTSNETHSIILEPLQFTATVTRNISMPTSAFPNVDIRLALDAIKLHVHEEDVQALIVIGLAASRITEVMASPPKPKEEIQTRPRFTTTFSRPKRETVSVASTARQRNRTRAGTRLRKFHTYEEVTDVRVEATLDSVTFDLTAEDGPLFKAGASGLTTKIDVLKKKVLVSGSARSLSVTNLGVGGSDYSKVVSIAEETDTVSSLFITVYTEEDRNPLSPMGKLQANIAQLQLFIPVPFVLRTVGFVQRLGIDKSMLETASKTAQDGATAVSSAAQDKFFKLDVKVHAPVLILPMNDQSTQGVMVDLGSLSVQNTLLIPDKSEENIGIDAYGITLNSFKISRVLLDPSLDVGSPVTAERMLLQPFNLLLAVERNLCPWYTSIPTININLNMEELKIFLGSEDLEQFFGFGMSVGDQVSTLLQKEDLPLEESLASSIEDQSPSDSTIAESAESVETSLADSEVEAFEFLRILSSLSGFEIKLFKDEPKLSVDDCKQLTDLDDFALTSLQLVAMEASVKMSSNNEVEVKASMKDIALCDKQKDRQNRSTGNRVIQHYTSNPLQAYTGNIEQPIVSVEYILRDDQHIVLLGAEKLLILSDIEFMKVMGDYFKAIFSPEPKSKQEDDASDSSLDPDETLSENKQKPSSKLIKQDTVTAKKKEKKATPLPKLKVNVSIKDFRVAIIENIDTPQPQALTLKVSTHAHVQLTELTKQVSLSVADLGIATSSFFDLDNTTSWVLLPCSISMSMTGPIDKPAMDIQAMVDPISLTLSPAIVRLIIHAIQTLIPEQEENVVVPPADLWHKKIISDSKLWFLSPVPLHTAITDGSEEVTEEKGEMMTVSIESVEIYLESESVDNSTGHPVLALNVSAVMQVFEWTGQLSVTGDIQCEASYYNEKVSLWEPLLEPLESKDGVQRLWEISLKMAKKSPKALQVSGTGDKPQFSVEVSADSPLQLTITKTSLALFKTLVEAYSKDYGKQVQGSVNVQALTGAPFTFLNKLGKDVVLFLQPGPTVKLKDKSEFSKLDCGESVDLYLKRDIRKRSYASMMTKSQKETAVVDIAVGNKFRHLKSVPIDVPGEFYYTLIPNKKMGDSLSTYGLVVEVAVTGEKKTITARSPVQFNNQLLTDVELLSVNCEKPGTPSSLAVLKPNETFSVPIHIAYTSDFFVKPSGFGFESEGDPISWRSKQPDTVNLKCVLPGSEQSVHFIRVNRQEEVYKVKRNLPKDDFPHHVFHLHPPLVVHNLLPFDIYVGSGYPSRCIEPGKFEHLHDVDLIKNPEMAVMVVRPHGSSLKGKFTLSEKPSQYINFHVSEETTSVELSAHTENESYLKLGVFCPFWMVNKTDLTLLYKEGGHVTNHEPGDSIVLLSTNNSKNKIQLGAITANKSQTEMTKSFSLSAIGSSGNFTAKLGEHQYKFGVEIRLSQFTLTKLVIVTPYYLLVNETKSNLEVYEETTPRTRTTVPSEEVIPFWPLTSGNKLVVVVNGSEEDEVCSTPFNYHKSDFTVLQLDKNSQMVAVCLETQESESATVVTFSPYYPGCVPVQLINHFPDMTLQFSQDTKSPLAITHTLQPREMMKYTWDDPSGRKVIKWNFPGAKVHNCKPIDVNKDSQDAFNLKFTSQASIAGSLSSSIFKKGKKSNSKTSVSSPPPVSGVGDAWLEVDETFSEQLVTISHEEEEEEENEEISDLPESSLPSSSSPSFQIGRKGSPRSSISSDSPSISSKTSASNGSVSAYRGHWKSFIDGLQRVIVFTPDEGVVDRIRAENSYSVPLFEASLSLRSLGLSLVDNNKKRELAYIAITQSGIIWQIDKGKGIWKTVNTSLIVILEEAYQKKEIDVKLSNLSVNLETMEMYTPIKGKLRRTHHDGVFVKFALSEKDYSVQAKIGYVQVDNQLPFSVYPQVLYPIPPPPTVASSTDPKPFVEASLILRKNDQSSGYHFKYVHVLVQKMAVNVDLGFILSLVDFFSISGSDPLFQAEYVEGDIDYVKKSLKETVVPELAEDFSISRSFFDVLHLAPIKVTLSFNIRSVGKNKDENEITAGDRFLELFLHSIGVILTSVQETEMKFSCFHLEYQPQTGRGLTNLLIKHYRNQALFQLHTLIFGLDVLGNPVSVVRGVVEGAIDLFYEPIKGSVLGPEEFFEGLGLGLRSFFGAGVVGGITGAGARITGAVGDVFAKLSFDDEFIDKRQQQKSKPPKLGRKLGGFAKNLFEGVTGVVTQPVKGLQKGGAVGLLKGTGRGLVGLIIRPTGGLVDLASGTLSFVTRKTQIGNFEITDIRPPRFIGRNGVISPYSPHKAIGTALLVGVDEGKYVESDYYFGHVLISENPPKFVLITDRRFMVIERRILTEGWKSANHAIFEFMTKPVESKDVNVVVTYDPKYKDKKLNFIVLSSEDLATDVAHAINESYMAYFSEH